MCACGRERTRVRVHDAEDDCAPLTRVLHVGALGMVQEIIVHLFSNNGESALRGCASSCVCVPREEKWRRRRRHTRRRRRGRVHSEHLLICGERGEDSRGAEGYGLGAQGQW